jgi:hypothetical protein
MYLMRPALSAPATAKDALTIEQAARWTYDKDAIRIGDLTISADHKALLVAVPGISAKIRTDTDDIMIVALHVVLLDENGNLITAECLSNPLAGLIEPGEEKTVAIRLQTSSRDIARAKHVRLGVTRAPVHRVSGGGTV